MKAGTQLGNSFLQSRSHSHHEPPGEVGYEEAASLCSPPFLLTSEVGSSSLKSHCVPSNSLLQTPSNDDAPPLSKLPALSEITSSLDSRDLKCLSRSVIYFHVHTALLKDICSWTVCEESQMLETGFGSY